MPAWKACGIRAAKRCSTEIGVSRGCSCLEVGAGGGSLVEWLIGRGATVMAIDIDTRFIEPLASDVVEVRRVDLRTDELPQARFDLVHARLVLEHLTERRQILDRLAAALRPGGWLVIEDYDWTCFGFEGDDRAWRVWSRRSTPICSARAMNRITAVTS